LQQPFLQQPYCLIAFEAFSSLQDFTLLDANSALALGRRGHGIVC
jgi:hypothetical protein